MRLVLLTGRYHNEDYPIYVNPKKLDCFEPRTAERHAYDGMDDSDELKTRRIFKTTQRQF